MDSSGDNKHTSQFSEHGGSSASRSQFAIGQLLTDKYRVVSLLGTGGMGKVYKVEQTFLGKLMALKVLDSHQLISDVQMRRFQLEAKAAFGLNHNNLVKVYDFGLLENEIPYLVMDLVDGITLQDYVKKNGVITPQQAVKIFTQVCDGLAYAHRHSVVHRDIKPSNIMLDVSANLGAKNSVKIVDFGIAKFSDGGEIQELTKTGDIFGSPYYMSPEQCSGERVDQRSDIYSLGCTIFEVLTGTPPHVGPNALRTMMLHQSAPVPLMKEASLGMKFPDNLEQIVQKMLKKNPAERYQNLEDVSADLSDMASDNKNRLERHTMSVSGATLDELPNEVSISRFKFVALIALLICCTSAISLYGLNLYQKAENARITLAKQRQERIARKKSLESSSIVDVFDNADASLSSVMEKQTALFEKVGTIKSSLATEGGAVVESINFPPVSLGYFTNQSFSEFEQRRPESFEKEARGNVKFAPSNFLRLEVKCAPFLSGQGSLPPLRAPFIFSKISPDLFNELEIHHSEADLYVGVSFNRNQQSENVGKILKNVAGWKKLSGIHLKGFEITNESWSVLYGLKNLTSFSLSECDFRASKLSDSPFLRKLKFFSLTQYPCKEIIESLAGSSSLEYLVLNDTDVPADLILKLQSCPNLKQLGLKPNVVNMELIRAIAQLKSLEVVAFGRVPVTAAQVRELLRLRPSIHTIVVRGNCAEEIMPIMQKDSRVKIDIKLPEIGKDN